MRSMSPFASACLVQAVLVDGGWYWLCLLHYHTNNFQTFAQAQNNQHAETIALVQSVQWCTMMYNVCFDKYSWCPPDAFPKAVWSYRSTEKMSHSLRRHPYIQTKTVHSCWFSDFQWNVKSAWTQGKTVLARVIVISFVWFCDPLWSFVILRDPLWSFVILGKHLLTLCAFTSRLMTSGSGISRGLCSQGMQFKVL